MPERAPLAIADVRWWPGPDLDAARLPALVRALEAALAAGPRDQKEGRRKESFLLALEGSEPDYLLKVNHYAGVAPWRRLRRSKARAEMARAQQLAARGIPTPIPVAAGELRRAGLLDRCYGLVRFLPDATDLLKVWRERGSNTEQRHVWTRELGALVRRMHDAGVHQEDLAPNNFLWRPAAATRLLAIDFERTRVGRSVARRERAFALAKLDRHFSGASAASRMRFLRAYARGDRDEVRDWWNAVTESTPRLARRDLRHWTKSGTRAGRRFTVLEFEIGAVAWRGFARRNAQLEALRAALARATESLSLRRLDQPAARDPATWGAAQMLYQRRLAPEPIALLRSANAAYLAFAAGEDLAELGDLPASARRAALAVAIDRLVALGADPARLRADAFAIARGRGNALLLDPALVLPMNASARTGCAPAREWAARLLD